MKISENDIKNICSAGIYKAGCEYYREGRVHIRVRGKDRLVSSVDSDRLYDVHIGFDDDGAIKETFCTCAYYQTMGANCKHIAATLKARQSELESGEETEDDNDRVAGRLCREFEKQKSERQQLRLSFILNVNTDHRRECRYSMSLKIGGSDNIASGVESFLHAFSAGGEYKLSKHRVYSNSLFCFTDAETAILSALSEAYQNKITGSSFYSPKLTASDFGSDTAKRIFPVLEKTDFKLVINGMPQSNLAVKHEDPDILVDLTATDDNINISVPQSGLALVPDGSWFFYEGDIYKTNEDWRGWFMPIYRALATESRTQIDFKGANSVDFAMNVLPRLRGKRGVVEQGIEHIIIDDKPQFDIYFDRFEDGISAVITVSYGNISIRLPEENKSRDKIIVRDYAAERYVLSVFSDFNLYGQVLYLDDSDRLYEFFAGEFKKLKNTARVHTSESFDAMRAPSAPKIRSRVSYNSGIDLLEVGFESDLTPSEIAGILHAVRNKKKYYRLKNGAFFELSQKAADFDILANLDFGTGDLKEGVKKVSKYHALYLSKAAEQGSITAEDSFGELIDKIKGIRADIPPALDKILREYQKTGVHWLKQLSELGYGGILADDMGLGKTLEVIAFVMSEKPELPALVVTPSSLAYNWLSEINRFAPKARTVMVSGTKEERVGILSGIKDCDFVITSYPLLRRDIQEYMKLKFSYCFIDEAQNIKNPKTLSAKAVKKISSGGCFALSGTPIENSLTELWSIFDFIMPGYLLSHQQFSERFEKPVTKDGDEAAAESLRRKIKPFILRRMKYEVLSELPPKIENTFFAELTPQQKKIYSAYLAAARAEISQIDIKNENMRILALLMRLRQICCHPRLIDEEYDKESGKLELFDELISTAIPAGHRVLVFSQFTSMLEMIRQRLKEKGIDCFYMDGHTPSALRTEMADRFNSGERCVFLSSLKAGGTGLNLIGADTVIHYDPWWNPAAADQASDRAYRIGQTKAVHVIKLASRGTIEEQILKLQDKKRALADNMIRTNSAMLSNLTKEEILSLFS